MESTYKPQLANKGVKQQTFVFKPQDMEKHGNIALNAFCEAHNVLSILFSECSGRLVYVMLYKD